MLGGASITAKFNGVSGSITVSVTPATLVSINIEPAATTIAKGTTVQLRAMGVYSDTTKEDLTSQVDWTVPPADAAVASINPLGLVTGLNKGPATITATALPPLGTASGSAIVTVNDAVLTSIAITPANFSLPNGATQQLTATGTFSDLSTQDLTSSVIWNAGSLGAINSAGLLTATAPGTGTITASQPGVEGTTGLTVTNATLMSITVTPATSSIAVGSAIPLFATCSYSAGPPRDCTTQVGWQSSAVGTATVDSSGSLAPGLVRRGARYDHRNSLRHACFRHGDGHGD
jgi:hypothetical protein